MGLALEAEETRDWKYFFEKGKAQYQIQSYDYAILCFINALDGNPDLYEAANSLGEIYAIKNQKYKSLQYYGRSLKINDRQPEIHYRVSEIYDAIGKFDLALRHSRIAIQQEPSHLKANLLIGRYAYLEHKSEEANRHISACEEEAKKACGPLLSDIKALMAAAAVKDAAKITQLSENVLSRCPCLTEAYEGLYEFYRSKKNYPEAARTMERLIEARPDYEHAYLNLGGLYFDERFPGNRRHHIDKAIRFLKKAIEINPGNAESHYNLARIYHRLGKKDLAREHEARALAIERKR